VVSDQNMPGMRGSEFLRRVWRDHPETIRILLTGSGDGAANARAVEEGLLHSVLFKPVMPRDLARAIREALGATGARRHGGRSMKPASAR
jgi:response regulator RpfG family c-di-GMP phosphodiesterase